MQRIIFLGCVAACATTVAAQRHQAPTSPLSLFQSRCAECHTVPDPAFATDRVWLEQVKTTT